MKEARIRMASKNKSFTIKSVALGDKRVTIPADTYNEVKKYHWYLDAVGKNRTVMVRAYDLDGNRVYLQKLIYGDGARLGVNDGNWCNLSERNVFARGE